MTPDKPTCICGEINARNCPVHQGDKPTAPRQWWIVLQADGDPYESHGFVFERLDQIAKTVQKDAIHVIEKSAFEKLRAENAEYRKTIKLQGEEVGRLKKQLKPYLSAERWVDEVASELLAEAAAALKFYASEGRYFRLMPGGDDTTEIEHDCGHIAKAALEKLKHTNKGE